MGPFSGLFDNSPWALTWRPSQFVNLGGAFTARWSSGHSGWYPGRSPSHGNWSTSRPLNSHGHGSPYRRWYVDATQHFVVVGRIFGIEVDDGGGGGALAASHEESEEQNKKQVSVCPFGTCRFYSHIVAMLNLDQKASPPAHVAAPTGEGQEPPGEEKTRQIRDTQR